MYGFDFITICKNNISDLGLLGNTHVFTEIQSNNTNFLLTFFHFNNNKKLENIKIKALIFFL